MTITDIGEHVYKEGQGYWNGGAFCDAALLLGSNTSSFLFPCMDCEMCVIDSTRVMLGHCWWSENEKISSQS